MFAGTLLRLWYRSPANSKAIICFLGQSFLVCIYLFQLGVVWRRIWRRIPRSFHKSLLKTPQSTFNSSSPAVSTTSAVISSTEVMNPSKLHRVTGYLRVGINFSKTHINVDSSTSSHESQVFLMASE